MTILLDPLVAVEGARMVREHGIGCLGVDDAHAFVARDHRQISLHVGVRHAVVVLVEAEIRSLADPYLEAFVDGEFVLREDNHERFVLGEGLDHRLVLLVGDLPLEGDLVAPRHRLYVEIGDRREVPRAAKKLSRTSWIARSTRPFSFGRYGAHARGSKR